MAQEKDRSRIGKVPPLFLSARFDDFDAATAAAQHWQAEFLQLDSGGFEASMSQILSESGFLLRCWLGRGVEQRGEPPEGCRTFGIPLKGCVEFFWRGHWIGENQLIMYPQGAELGSRSFRGFNIYAFSLRESVIERLARQPGSEWLMDGKERVVSSTPGVMRALRDQAEAIEGLARSGGDPRLLHGRVAGQLEELGGLLVAAMSRQDLAGPVPSGRSRDQALDDALAVIDGHLDSVMTVAQLCEATGVSRRTLQYAFEERFQLSPKQYLTARRLVEVRRRLRERARHGEIRVGETAAECGFWHMGQFAADFRRQFGILPSEFVASA